MDTEKTRQKPRKAIIMGATSGIGLEVARELHRKGWEVAIAGRRLERLEVIRRELGQGCLTRVIDVVKEDATAHLLELIEDMGGMDLYFHSAGIGFQNPGLEKWKEMDTIQTNTTGFTRMVVTAFNYFSKKGEGHIAAISSIAGTKGLGIAPSYSATKRFQSVYLEALAQLAHMKGKDISILDIRPGFVDTDLLSGGSYPMKMNKTMVARQIIWAIFHHRQTIVVDWRYRLLTIFWSMIPRWLWVRLRIGKI